MLLKVNKLNNVSDQAESLQNASAQLGSGDSLLPTSAQSTIKSALRNDSNRSSNASTTEPSVKKAKNGHYDSLNEDFIPFSNSSTTRGNGDGTYGDNRGFSGNGNGNSFQTGRQTSGQNDLAQKSKEALHRRAQENSARRRQVDNPCTYFSQGTHYIAFVLLCFLTKNIFIMLHLLAFSNSWKL